MSVVVVASLSADNTKSCAARLRRHMAEWLTTVPLSIYARSIEGLWRQAANDLARSLPVSERA